MNVPPDSSARPRTPRVPAPGAPAATAPANPVDRVRGYGLFLTLAAVTFVLDQLSKLWIAHRLPYPSYGLNGIPVIDGFFNLVHVGNTGAAWSMFAGQSVVLGLLAAATLVAIFIWRRALGLRDRTTQLCFGLLCGGIAGNLLDRVTRGHVVDFIDLHFGSYIYPTFNIADSGICVGVILYIVHSLRNQE